MPEQVVEARVHIQTAMCEGHGRCYMLAPEVFEADDDGRGVVITETVTGVDLVAAQKGAMNCPESAITVVTTDSSGLVE